MTTDTGSGDGTVSISNNQLTISPMNNLAADTEYAIQIAQTAITDTADTPNAYVGISNDNDLGFITADTKPIFTQATNGTISVSVTEDETLDLTSALEVNDVSTSDTLTWSLPNGNPNASNGTVSNLNGESVSYSSGKNHTLASNPEYVPNADLAGTGTVDDSFDVKVTDREGYSVTTKIEVEVQQVNDAPMVTLGSNQTLNGTTSQQTVDGFVTFAPSNESDEAGQRVDDYIVAVSSDPDGVLSAVDINNNGASPTPPTTASKALQLSRSSSPTMAGLPTGGSIPRRPPYLRSRSIPARRQSTVRVRALGF